MYTRVMTDDEITAAWKQNGTRASHMGSGPSLHGGVKLNGLPFPLVNPTWRCCTFCAEHMIPDA